MDDVAVVGTILGSLIPIVMFIGLFTFLVIAVRAANRRKAEEAHARYEFLRKIAEGASFDAEKLLEFEKGELRMRKQRRLANLRLAGILILAVGLGTTILFFAVGTIADEARWVVSSLGLVPIALGVALLVAWRLEARELKGDEGT